MRSAFVLSVIIGFGICGRVVAQQHHSVSERTGIIIVRLSSTLDRSIGAAFESARPASDPTFAHSDINASWLQRDSTIASLLNVVGLHGVRLHPFIPTHSIAYEDIRERSNPQLFQQQVYSISIPNGPPSDSSLRTAETRVAHWFYLAYSDSISPEIAARLARKSSRIEDAEPEYIRKPLFVPNDSLVSQQYSLSAMNCFRAWDIVRCDSTMIVADADIGTDWTHEDLVNSIFQNPGEIGIDAHGNPKQSNGIDDDSNGFVDDWHGWDFGGTGTAPDNNPMPGNGITHGTQTAGILDATGNNSTGIAGVAFGAKLIPIKISDDGGNLDFGFQGIIYAADMHAKLVNCSWGGPGQSSAEQDVIDYSYAKDCLVVAAAGNNGILQLFYPASYRHVLSVAASDWNSSIVGFSNFNTNVDVAAPGLDILSTIPGNQYVSFNESGTSFACPNTAGVVALVRQRFPNFTAGQAAEQVRVTTDTISALDPNRVFYEGHGIVDAFRAVSETNTFSARVDTFWAVEPSNTGSFQPGESGSIVIRAMNFLSPLPNLHARIEIVNGAQYINLHQAIVPFGSVGSLRTIANDPANFQLTVADSVPSNTEVLIRVFFYDSTAGYAEDYDYIRFVIRPSYINLNGNNLTVTFSSYGSIGYNDVLNNSEGSGFTWSNAPDSISVFARQVIYEGGLMIGVDTSHVVDVVVGADGNSPDEDLTPSVLTHYVVPPDQPNAAQEVAFAVTDSLADTSVQIGLRATCNAYAFTQGFAANAVIVRYVFRGSPGGLLAATDSAAAALFLDWDIGPSGGLNITRFDSATSTALTYRVEPNYPLIGVKLISPPPAGSAMNYHAIMNNGSVGTIDLYSSYSKQDKWNTMNDFFPSAGIGDVSHTFGLKGMPIHSDDSTEMTFVIALAASKPSLDKTISEAITQWNDRSSVPLEDPTYALEVFPNPFRNALHISWDAMGPARVTISDAIGRIVISHDVSASAFDFEPPVGGSGVYMVDVAVAGKHLRREVVAVP